MRGANRRDMVNAGRRIPVLRILLDSQRRARLLPMVAVLASVVAAGQMLFVLASLGATAARSDFAFWYAGARDLGRGVDPYSEFLACCTNLDEPPRGYDYPPLLAQALRPLSHLSLVAASAIWLLLMAVCVVGVILLMHRLVSPALSSQARSLLLAASLLFAPLLLNIGALQLGPLLALILAVAAYGFVRTRRAYPGVALGFGGVLRLSPLLLVVLFIRRPRDILSAPVVAAVTTTAGGVLLMLLLIPYTLEFVLRVLPKLSQGSAYFDNLSLSGVLMRGQLLATHRVGPWTARLAQLLGVALVAITWWRCRSARGERQRAVAFAAVLATLPIVSPLTWSHHLVLELLVYALLAPSLVSGGGPWVLALLSYPLLDRLPEVVFAVAAYGLHLPGWGAAWFNLGANVATLVGMGLLWAACMVAMARMPGPGALGGAP
jgi:hypothetical protein